MVRREEVEIIRERALSMLKAAIHHYANGEYDLAAFLAEQAAQLYIKYKILEATGEMPRTHIIRQLLGILQEISKDADKIREFTKKNRSMLIRLEEAYIAARYLPRRYEKEECRELVEFTQKVINLVRNIQI